MALISDPVSMRKCVCVYYDQLQKIGNCEEGQEHLLLLVSSLGVSPTARFLWGRTKGDGVWMYCDGGVELSEMQLGQPSV